MLWAVSIILGLLWAAAMASSSSIGGYVHLLLAVAIVLTGFGIYRHRRTRSTP